MGAATAVNNDAESLPPRIQGMWLDTEGDEPMTEWYDPCRQGLSTTVQVPTLLSDDYPIAQWYRGAEVATGTTALVWQGYATEDEQATPLTLEVWDDLQSRTVFFSLS